MSLEVLVGILDGIEAERPEYQAAVSRELAAVDSVMREHGLAPHVEPKDVPAWSVAGYGYSGLHALREVAGLVWANRPLPSEGVIDGRDMSFGNALFEAIFPVFDAPRSPGFISRLFGRRPAAVPDFAHLVAHPDSAGYYVPADFAAPVMPSQIDEATAHLWPLGSVPRLLAELNRLADVLSVPAHLSSGDAEIAELLEEPDPEGPLWRAQPIATYSLLILREACARSLETGAAIRFS